MPGQRLSTTIKPKKSRFAIVTDIIGELKKVVWPTRQETVRLSLLVIGVCIVIGIFLGALDLGFAELISKVFLGG